MGTSGYCICESKRHSEDALIAAWIREIARDSRMGKLSEPISRYALQKIVLEAEREAK